MSPCIITVGTSCARSCRASDSTRRFVFTNTSVRSRLLVHQLDELLQLLVRPCGNEPVVRLLHGLAVRFDLVADGVLRVHVGDPADGAVERGGEEHRLPIPRQEPDDTVDLRLEPHVEHAVSLVQHEDLDAVQLDQLAVGEILQASGGGDEDVRIPHALRLLGDARAAVHHLGLQMLRARDIDQVVLDLLRELARGHQDQRGGMLRVIGRELLDDRDREPQRLAGAGLRLGERIAAGRGVLDHHHLDREGLVDAPLREGVDHRVGYAEVPEGCDGRCGGWIHAQRAYTAADQGHGSAPQR